MLYSPVRDIQERVTRQHDEFIEACFLMLGIDRHYLIENAGEFRVEIYPEGRKIYYQNDVPLFSIVQTVDVDLETCQATISHEVKLMEREEVSCG